MAIDTLRAGRRSLILGGAGALVGPWLRPSPPTLSDVCVIAGFAVLIIRTRFKEG